MSLIYNLMLSRITILHPYHSNPPLSPSQIQPARTIPPPPPPIPRVFTRRRAPLPQSGFFFFFLLLFLPKSYTLLLLPIPFLFSSLSLFFSFFTSKFLSSYIFFLLFKVYATSLLLCKYFSIIIFY